MTARPWMPLYVSDYLGDTRRLKTVEHGAYMLLIMEYWQHGGLPESDEDLAEIVGMEFDEWKAIKPRISRFFQDGWRHKRIDAELAKASDISSKRSASARKRHANAEQMQSDCSAKDMHRARVPQPQPQPQSQSNIRETTSLSSPAEPDDAHEPICLESEKLKRRRSADPDLLREVGESWNELAADIGLPQVNSLTEKRKSAIMARSRELTETYDFPDARAGWSALFGKIRGSPFLRGDTGRWRADFDFAITQSSFTKIMEGAYADQKIQRR